MRGSGRVESSEVFHNVVVYETCRHRRTRSGNFVLLLYFSKKGRKRTRDTIFGQVSRRGGNPLLACNSVARLKTTLRDFVSAYTVTSKA